MRPNNIQFLSGTATYAYVHVELRLVKAVSKCIICDTEVCKSIAIVCGDWMDAMCTLLSYVTVTLAISLYCIALCYRWS